MTSSRKSKAKSSKRPGPGAVLITGGCGFLGSHLAERLARQGRSVVAVDNFATGSRFNRDYLKKLKSVRLIEADVTREWGWASRLAGKFSTVFHFASPASPPHYQRLGLETLWVNSVGLQKALAFADKRKARLIFASTSEIYGDPELSPQPESYWGHVNSMGPRSCYDEAKRFGEALLHTHNLKHGTKHGLVRIFNTYGPRMNPADGRVVVNFLVQALRGEALTVYGDGRQTRSFCYVDDLIDGILAYAESSETAPVNIGNDREFTILQLAEEVSRLFHGRSLEIKHLPPLGDDPRQRRPDLSRARERLQWQPRVSLQEGLDKMLSWLKTAKI